MSKPKTQGTRISDLENVVDMLEEKVKGLLNIAEQMDYRVTEIEDMMQRGEMIIGDLEDEDEWDD